MTPEQRLTKIENLLQTITEIQAKHEIETGELKNAQVKTDEQLKAVAQSLGRLSDMQERTESRLHTLIEHVDKVVGRVEKLEDR
jgi:chromosome segregation ATPase